MSGTSTAARSVTGVGTTSGSKALTAPAGSFRTRDDVGAPVSGTGIPAGATLAAVASDTAATLSANATATGTVAVSVGPDLATSAGFTGYVPTAASAEGDWTVAGVVAGNPPDVLTDNVTRVVQPVLGS